MNPDEQWQVWQILPSGEEECLTRGIPLRSRQEAESWVSYLRERRFGARMPVQLEVRLCG